MIVRSSLGLRLHGWATAFLGNHLFNKQLDEPFQGFGNNATAGWETSRRSE
jgi:hypothetical protein